MWACHIQDILFQARTGTSLPRWLVGQSASRTPLCFIFKPKTVENKKQHQTHVKFAGGMSLVSGPGTGREQNLARHDPTRHFPKRVEPLNMPDPCQDLVVTFPFLVKVWGNLTILSSFYLSHMQKVWAIGSNPSLSYFLNIAKRNLL